jgi:hypothetical protein
MEGHYVVIRVFSRYPVEFWDIGRYFGRDWTPKWGMQYGIIGKM